MLDAIVQAGGSSKVLSHVVVEGYPKYVEQLHDLIASRRVRGRVLVVRLSCDPRVLLRRRAERGRHDDVGSVGERRHDWQQAELTRIAEFLRARYPSVFFECDTTVMRLDEVVNWIGSIVHHASLAPLEAVLS